jgi:proline dehydrogenase
MLPDFNNTEIAFKYKTNWELKKAQLLFMTMNFPTLSQTGIKLTNWCIKVHLPIKPLIKNTIFSQFCGGETMEEAAKTVELLNKYHVGVIMDYGVEGKESESDFDKAVPQFINTIKYAASHRNIPFISLKITGFARFALMEKIHARQPLTDAEKAEWERVYKRIEEICSTASKNKVMVLIDAEETWIQEAVNDLTDAMMEKYNKENALIFNTFQFYCHGTLDYLKSCIETASSKGYKLGAKLVRGAYMEKERARALKMGYQSPIQPDKESTDRDYDAGVLYSLQNLDKLSLFIGTHNEKSCLEAARYMEDRNISPADPRIYFSQLFGMSDNISFNMGYQGYNVAKYLPYGPVTDVVPYLLRRAQENTSVKGQTGRELSLINKELQRRKEMKRAG